MSKSLFVGVGLENRECVVRGAWCVARFTVVTVMAMVFGLAGFLATAEAANVTYHMRGVAAQSVGTDGNTNVVAENGATYEPIVGAQYRAIALTTASANNVRNRMREGVNWTGTEQFLRLYTPQYVASKEIGANATGVFTTYSAAGQVYAEMYEYNDTTGVVGGVKGTTNTASFTNIAGEEVALTFDNGSFTVASGNRLVIYYYLISSGADPRPIYGAASFNTTTPQGDIYFTVDETDPCIPSGSLSITSGQTLAGNPVDLTSISSTSNASNVVYTVTDGAASPPYTPYTENFATGDNFGSWVATDDDATASWLTLDGQTPSGTNTVGPTADQSGSGFFAYTEGTGGDYAAPINYYLTSPSIDNANYETSLNFYWNKNHNGQTYCYLYVDASSDNGSTWDNIAIWSPTPANVESADGATWTQATVDLKDITPTGGQDFIKVRFHAEGGEFECDTGLDTITIDGTPRATTYYDSSVDGPATSVDTTAWPSPSILTLTIDGDDASCGTPLTQAQDTFDFTDCTPTGSIVWNGTNTATSDFNGSSLATESGVNTVQYKVTSGSSGFGECTVSSGRQAFADGQSTMSASVSISDPSQAFLLVDIAGGLAETNTENHMTTGYIQDASTLRFDRVGSTGPNAWVSYQLVECTGNIIDVQRGEITLGAGNGTNTGSLGTAVTVADSVVLVNTRSSNASTAQDMARVKGWLSNGSTVSVQRQNTAGTTTVRYEVVEFQPASGASVQPGTFVFDSSGAASQSNTITAVDPTRSWLVGSWDANTNGLSQTTVGLELTNATTVTAHREAVTNAQNDIQYYVVEFPSGEVSVNRGTYLVDAGTDPNAGDDNEGIIDIIVPAVSATNKAFTDTYNETQGTGTAFARNSWIEGLTSTTNLRQSNWRTNATNSLGNHYWQVIEFTPTGGETTVIDWNADPQEATGTLTNGNTYNVYARGLDNTCTTSYVYGDASTTNTTADGMSQSVTWTDCTDGDLATLTTTAPTSGSTVNGNSVLIQTQVGNEPGANMTGMAVTIAGSSSCNVTDAAMTWNGTSSRWEYIWDTSACGTGAAETGITIDVSGVEPDCSTPTINAAQITNITIDNTCTPGSITYDGGVPNPITTATFDFTPYITLTNGSGSTVSNAMYSVNGDTWTSVATPYTLPAKTAATINVRFKADDTCSGTLYDDNGANDGTGPGYAMNIDTRIDPIEPVSQTITQTGLTGFTVRLVYCNDKNGNATFRVDYKLSSSGTWTNGTPISDGGAGDLDGLTDEEVSIAISGLVEGETYDIRMTYIDDTDGVIGTAEYIETKTLVAWVDDPLLHNALRFACDKSGYWDQTSCEGAGGVWTLDRKWATGWGTTGGEYGPIRCNTCHDKGTGNVKRVNNTITSSSGNFPGSAVTLTTVEDGTSDFGDDAGDHATSNKICEVCHTQTNYHRYDTTGQTGGTDHYNQADCIKCHEHKIGFRASCDACHASPPLDAGGLVTTDPTGSTTPGEHNVHVNTLGYTDCNTCHNGWQSNGEMPKSGEINIGFVTPGADGGIYNGRIGGGGYYNAGTLTTINTTDAMTCANYCHGYGTPQWNPTATADCGACHGKVGSFGDERAGAPTGGTSLDLSGVGTGTKVGKHANHLDDSVAETGDPCALCHFGTLYSDSTHVDGTVNVLLRQAAKTGDNSTGGAGTSAVFTPGATGRCSSLECHNDADWDSTVSGGCDFCHGYPPNSTNNSHATGVRPVDHDSLNILPNHGDCQFCHGYKNNGSDQLAFVDPATLGGIYTPVAGDHEDGATTMNGNTNGNATDDAGYNESNGGCSTTACHGNDATHQLTLPGAPAADVQLRDIGPGKCTSCHDGTDTNAPVVTLASTHTKVLKTDGTGSDCTVCHSGHYAGGTGVQIPNNTKVGINYAAAGHGGIMLGGTETTINATIRGLTTEAQVCWGCHDLAANTVSEWGVNQQAATGNLSYNYGTLSGSNWTTATWYSGKGATVSDPFWYKRGSIQSIHSTSTPGAGTNDGKGLATGSDYAKSEPIETAAAIRCSYCHDVHELAQASGDTKAGKPYLRGTWQGNIYPEDGAPLSGMTNWIQVPMGSANSSYMNVPRASASTTNTGTTGQANLGAYWIDQNNPNHNLNTLDADSFAGLCELCHGDGDGSWFTTASVANNEIDSIDQYTGENLWVSGNNGHLNVVKGASGTTATAHNIFDTSRRGSAQIEDRTSTRPNPYLDMGASSITARGYSWRETGEGGFGYQPLMTDPEPEAWRIFQWDLSGSINTGTATLVVDGGTFSYQDGTATAQSETTQKNYHTFTCAKCHNPHASRLPKLMITNCLDTKQNTWDENHTSQATNAAAAEWQNSYASQWPAAQNCHRLDERAPSSTTWGQGWNTVTPW